MNLRKSIVLGLFLFTGCGEPSANSDLDLVGGSKARTGQYASAILFMGAAGSSCTATKVSNRHLLTAAHCVTDSNGKLALDKRAGEAIAATNFPSRDRADTSKWHSGKIKSVAVHEEWTSQCLLPQSGCLTRSVDLAVIEFDADLPSQWPNARIDQRNVLDADKVTMVGYGCEVAVGSGPRTTLSNKKYGDAEVISSFKVNDRAPIVPAGELKKYASRYLLTPGRNFAGQTSADRASLCPGDSGGPVYRAGSDNIVVGVNSHMIPEALRAGDALNTLLTGTSALNAHTRLIDPWRQTNAMTWLQSKLPASAFTVSTR